MLSREEKIRKKIETLLTPEIVEAQKEFVIRNFYDLLRALIEHPDWLEILRELILTEELLSLPQKVEELSRKLEEFRREFNTFRKEEFQPLKEKVDRIEQDVEVLKQDVAVLKQDVAVLKQDVAVLKQDVETLKKDVKYIKGELGKVKGWAYEWKIKEHYPAYFGRVLRKIRRITLEELVSLAEDAEEQGLIDEEQYESLFELDLVVEGLLKLDKRPVVLAVEISHSVYEEDIERAIERANILATILNKEVIPAVIGSEVKEELMDQAESRGVLVIKKEV